MTALKSITVLKLKLVDHADLERIGQLCRKARNVAVENWLLRQRGMPESERQSKRLIRRKDAAQDKPKTEGTKLYHAIVEAVPELGTTQVSCVSQAVSSCLSAKVDWRRGNDENGKRLRRKDAILAYEDRPPFFTSLEIPLHNQHMTVTFTDRVILTIDRPLRDMPKLVIEVSIRDMPPGKQLILREIVDGKRKLSDSKLVQKEDGWYWHLPVMFETEVRSDIEAVLWPTIGSEKNGKQTDRPFRLELPTGRTWHVGDGRYLLAQTQRLIGLRKMIGWRYRQRMGAGHGRKSIDERVRRRRRQEWNMRTEVRRRAIADIIRQCVRCNCGTLIYREPTLPLRKKCWFAAMGLDWDWTRFVADLKNSAARNGVEVKVAQLKWKEAVGDAT